MEPFKMKTKQSNEMKYSKGLAACEDELCKPEVQSQPNTWPLLLFPKLDCDHEPTFYF